jgi:hypothetical protein
VVHLALIFRSPVLHTIADNTGDPEPPDPADIADADALEELLGSTTTNSTHEQLSVDETAENADLMLQPDQTEPGDQADAAELESASAVVIDKFPFGRPGAPIHHSGQERSADDSQGSPWGPFQSQLDWDVARWAKVCGQTSTAVSELLAIPGVCAYSFEYGVFNSIVIGC